MTNNFHLGEAGLDQQREARLGLLSNVLQVAIRRSRGAAVVNLGSMSQIQAISRLPAYFHHVTVDDILNRRGNVPVEKSALVVTGYSGRYYHQIEQEDRIEAFIRAVATTRGVNDGRFSVLVLSDS